MPGRTNAGCRRAAACGRRASCLAAAALVACALRAAGATNAAPPAGGQFKRPGVVADRAAGQVRVAARATGLPAGEIAEFLLIGERSGHDYEALAVSRAAPGDVKDALMFIGMRPGRPVDPDRQHFAPRGERAQVAFLRQGTNGAPPAVRAEHLISVKSAGRTMVAQGFVFAGSRTIASGDGPALAADTHDPFSIICAYSEPDSILVVPGWVPQGQVYGDMVIGTNAVFAKGEELTLLIEPAEGARRDPGVDLTLSARETPAAADATGVLSRLAFSLRSDDATVPEVSGLETALDALMTLVTEGREPFVRLDLDRRLTLRALRALCAVLLVAETERGVHIEPPEDEGLYYRAFVPPEGNRRRQERIGQPWELKLTAADGAVSGVLARIEADYGASITPELTVEEFPVRDAGALRDALRAHGPGMNVILVFADPSLRYGALLDFVGPVMPDYPLVHVYLEPENGPSR
ncbi:MAG: hypothetical protein FJ225_10040 [Lentisphaerae bacterium]|nr:hypothetical protein [Lentisphaerota bacterium]